MINLSNNLSLNSGEPLNSIGKRIRYVWERSGLHQNQFATLMNVSIPTLSSYFNDKVSPNTDFLIRLIKHASVPADWVLFGKLPNKTKETSLKSDTTRELNTDILEQVVAGIESALKRKHAALDPVKKAALIVLLYEHFSDDNNIKQDTVERFLRIAS